MALPSSPRKLDVRRCKSRGGGGTARDKVVGKLARPRELLRERDAGMDAVQSREDPGERYLSVPLFRPQVYQVW